MVTGAARSIGRAIAIRLAQDGAAVVVNYSGSVQQAQETVGLTEKSGGMAAARCPGNNGLTPPGRTMTAVLERIAFKSPFAGQGKKARTSGTAERRVVVKALEYLAVKGG